MSNEEAKKALKEAISDAVATASGIDGEQHEKTKKAEVAKTTAKNTEDEKEELTADSLLNMFETRGDNDDEAGEHGQEGESEDGGGEENSGGGDDDAGKEGGHAEENEEVDSSQPQHKVIASQRVKIKKLEEELKQLRDGGIVAELTKKNQELESVIEAYDYQKSSKFITEHKKPIENAIASLADVAGELGYDPKKIIPATGMKLKDQLDFLAKAIPNAEHRTLIRDEVMKISALRKNASKAIEEAAKNASEREKRVEKEHLDKLNSIRSTAFDTTMKELSSDPNLSFVLTQFKGDSDAEKKWNQKVLARIENAKKILFSDDAALQTKTLLRGALADDIIGMAKSYYDRAVKAEEKLANIYKRKPGVSSSTQVSATKNKEKPKDQMTAEEVADAAAKKLLEKVRK